MQSLLQGTPFWKKPFSREALQNELHKVPCREAAYRNVMKTSIGKPLEDLYKASLKGSLHKVFVKLTEEVLKFPKGDTVKLPIGKASKELLGSPLKESPKWDFWSL